MNYRNSISAAEVTARTRDTIHYFYSREMSRMEKMWADQFLWIGAYDFQRAENLQEFKKATHSERKEPPVQVSQEEYRVVAQEHHMWIVFARHNAHVKLEDGTALQALVRGTFVRQQIAQKLVLVHIHVSHAQDIPLISVPSKPTLPLGRGFFHYLRTLEPYSYLRKRIEFCDRQGTYYFLSPSEIRYLHVSDQWCTVYTLSNKLFEVRGSLAFFESTLPNCFFRIHRSYLVNLEHIHSIVRYEALLIDGVALPIAKLRYKTLKQKLMLLY